MTRACARYCRLAGGGQSGRAASAEKALERLQATKAEKPFEARARTFRFPEVENIGERVATIKNLTHGYNGRALFTQQSLEIGKGDRIAIIGPNGSGKSTLLRLLMGREKPQEGLVALGEHSIVPNYYEQNQSEALDLELTVLETLTQAADEAREDEIKALLGRMMFSRSSFDRKVGVLSGGEKARLALAKFMLTSGTLLVLDEPTNHLDIPSKEMLEQAIVNFEGAVIAVSHDRYFLRRIANRVVQVEGQQLVDYPGDYEFYLEVRPALFCDAIEAAVCASSRLSWIPRACASG
jgi:ATPase subunit of ABC transporter with duplicated ATPase domains